MKKIVKELPLQKLMIWPLVVMMAIAAFQQDKKAKKTNLALCALCFYKCTYTCKQQCAFKITYKSTRFIYSKLGVTILNSVKTAKTFNSQFLANKIFLVSSNLTISRLLGDYFMEITSRYPQRIWFYSTFCSQNILLGLLYRLVCTYYLVFDEPSKRSWRNSQMCCCTVAAVLIVLAVFTFTQSTFSR